MTKICQHHAASGDNVPRLLAENMADNITTVCVENLGVRLRQQVCAISGVLTSTTWTWKRRAGVKAC